MIRKKYFFLFVLIIFFIVSIRFIFLDSIVKYVFEKSLSSIPKLTVMSEVVKVSLLKGQVNIKNIAWIWEDNDDAMLTGVINFQIAPSHLLRGRLVVNELNVSEISFVTKDLVYWDSLKDRSTNKESKLTKVGGSILSYYSADNIADRLDLDLLLETKQTSFIKVINNELEGVRASYDVLMEKISSDDLSNSLNELDKAIKELERNRPQDISKIPKYLQDIVSLKNEYEKVKKVYDNKQKVIRQFEKRVDLAKKKIESAGKLDLELFDNKLKQVDTKKQSFASDLLGAQVNKYLGYVKKGIEALKSLKQGNSKPKRKTFKGIDIAFPLKETYPVFYIKELSLSGKDKFNKGFKGYGKDITHQQSIRGIPARLELMQNLGSAVSFMGITIDLREDVQLLAEGFRQNYQLKDSYWDLRQVPLSITTGKYHLDLSAKYTKNTLHANLGLRTDGLNLALEPAINKKSVVERYFFESLSQIPNFALQIKVDGDKLMIDSNIDQFLISAQQAMINKELDKLKANYTNQWQEYVNEQEKRFQKELEKLVF